MNKKLFTFVCTILSVVCLPSLQLNCAQPLAAASSSSSLSPAKVLPTLTQSQQEKLDTFKEKYSYDNPTDESILNLVLQDNIHPDYIRYGHSDRNCALGRAIRFSHCLLLARYLLEHGANPNSLDDHEAILINAASVKAAQLLVEYKANIALCANHLLSTTICLLSQRTPELIRLYIQQGVDPDLPGGITNNHPMIQLSMNDSVHEPEKLCAQYLIEGGTSLSYKSKSDGWNKGYNAPQLLKKKLAVMEASAEQYKADRKLKNHCKKYYAEIQDFRVHVKKLADDRRSFIYAAVTTHLPVSGGQLFPLAELVTDYYEPTYEQMENEPLKLK